MSQTKYPMPSHVKALALADVRGYEYRLEQYHRKIEEVLHSSYKPFDTYEVGNEERYFYHSHSNQTSRPVEGTQSRLEAIENHPETIRMRAVEQAKHGIGIDLPQEQREKLAAAIWDSCIYGRNFTFSHYNLPTNKTTFYERRREFLWYIAIRLGYIEEG